MYSLTDKKDGVISPRKAEDLLKLNTFEDQRPLSGDHVQNLRTAIADGTFRRADIAIAKQSYNGGRQVLVNGQHQLHAVIQSGKPVRGIVEYYDCPERKDLWTLFSTFDSHRARTELHVLRFSRSLFASDSLRAVPLRVLQLAGSCLLYLGGSTKPNFSAKSPNKRRKVELIQQYASDVLLLREHYEQPGGNLLTIGPATALLVCHRLNESKAKAFWSAVITGENISRDDAAYKLRAKLLRPLLVSGDGRDRIRDGYNLSIAWWNTFREGRDRGSVKIAAIRGILDATA